MVTSPVPIYLGCAGLIVGCLGLGAQHMLGASSAPPTTVQEQPLFARSVEEAALPAARWPSQNPEVAFYEPMVELLTTPARTSEPSQPVASDREEAQVSAPREIVRDVPREQVRQSSRRAKNARARNEVGAPGEAAPRCTRSVDLHTYAKNTCSLGNEASEAAAGNRRSLAENKVVRALGLLRRPRGGCNLPVREIIVVQNAVGCERRAGEKR